MGFCTDRETDNMQSQDRAMHYSASRGKNNIMNKKLYNWY